MNKKRTVVLLKIFTLIFFFIESGCPANTMNDTNLKTSNADTRPSLSGVWVADNGDGTYKNPILYADYSDPDVIRVGGDYYMTASSFSSIPGLPILHSTDLVNWELIGYALSKYPNDSFDTPQHGKGVWAPSIRYQNDYFYIYWGDPDDGVYMVRTKNIRGRWEPPVLVLPGRGLIDSCPFWDDDGQAYLVHGWAASRIEVNSLLTLHKMNSEGTQAEPDGIHIFDGNSGNQTIEGPKMYKRNGYYYILAPAGGVPTGWQLAMRSKDILGPYEDKVVLEQGSTVVNGPHQGGWVQTESGQSWFLHFQDAEAYGRIVHLQPVTWQDDWPNMGVFNESTSKQEPVLTYEKPDVSLESPIVTPPETDEFDGTAIGLQWQWQANPKLTWQAKLAGTDYLRLFPLALPAPSKNLWDAGNVLLQKFPAPDFTATTKMTFVPKGEGKRSGLVVMGADYACLSVTYNDGDYFLSQITCKDADKGRDEKTVDQIKLPGNSVYLRVTVTGPDAECTFSYSPDGQNYSQLGQSFTAVPGRWIGAKVGLFCVRTERSKTGGYADFDFFRISR